MPRALLITLLAMNTLAGCRQAMVVPTMFASGQVNAVADEPTDKAGTQRSIFYVTDRLCARDNGDGNVRYGRGRNDSLEAGRVNILFGNKDTHWQTLSDSIHGGAGKTLLKPTISGIDRFGTLIAPRLHPLIPYRRLTREQSTPNEAATKFITELNDAVNRSKGKSITIYIHGFNQSFKTAALTTAEYELITGGLGPFVLYSWPSYDSLWEYSHDRDSVRFTAGHARRLIEFFADEIAAGRLQAKHIHFIAHSSGAQVIGTVLRELNLLSREMAPIKQAKTWRIDRVIMVSPDVSVDVARERLLKEDMQGTYRRIVVYTSPQDRALQWASRILYRTVRLGATSESDLDVADRHWLSVSKRVQIINADSAPYGGFVNHSHHRFSPDVASDIVLSLRTRLTPEERGLVRDTGDLIWRFPNDYKQRVTEAAAKAYADEVPEP